MITFNRTTPILFLIFNRPETTLRVFDRIRKMQPERLYIAADGPRTPEEKHLCDAARAAATTDWDCDVHTLFRDGNLGCGEAVSRAITWFFENEPEGIILEDDCLPADGFFGFCSAMLEKYRDDDRIGHISGGNYQNGIKRGDGSYYFSGLTNVWGWAGWRRVWKDYDRGMKTWPQFEQLDRLEKDPGRSPFARIWRSHFKTHHAGFNSWDYQYAYLNLVNHRLSVIPNVNLITNIGCEDRASATHFMPDHPFAGLPAGEPAEIIPPAFMMADVDADLYAQSVEFKMLLSPESTVGDFLFLKEKLVSLSEPCGSKMSIPRIIHQIYEDPDIPEDLLKIAETWKQYHPGWEYRFWDKAAINDFLETCFPEKIPLYGAFPFDVQRWDAIRYLILYCFGGLYADMDYECLEPLDALLTGSICCMGMEPHENAVRCGKPHVAGNALMAAVPGHGYIKMMIDEVFRPENISIPQGRNKAVHVIETTGPFMTTRIYDAYPRKEDVTLLPPELVAPLTLEEVQQILDGHETEEMEVKLEKAFAVHYFFGSWVSQTVTGENVIDKTE